MPSLIDIRRRIRSVKNTQQITKAMKMVSSAKLRKAQERVIAARPYSRSLQDVLRNVALAAEPVRGAGLHPLLERREEKRIQLVLFTADRGLAGAFNSNLIKAAQQFIAGHANQTVELECIGRKGRDFFRRRPVTISGEHVNVYTAKAPDHARQIARKLVERYERGQVDAVYLMANTFKSVLAADLTVFRLLPIELPPEGEPIHYLLDEDPRVLLAMLLPRYVEAGMIQAFLECMAAEHAARMTAMDAASTNAAEVIDKLTLYLNRVRQASITKEIIEIVSGAAALE
jgi:F-type H+-transporting ATPase subunit gamma